MIHNKFSVLSIGAVLLSVACSYAEEECPEETVTEPAPVADAGTEPVQEPTAPVVDAGVAPPEEPVESPEVPETPEEPEAPGISVTLVQPDVAFVCGDSQPVVISFTLTAPEGDGLPVGTLTVSVKNGTHGTLTNVNDDSSGLRRDGYAADLYGTSSLTACGAGKDCTLTLSPSDLVIAGGDSKTFNARLNASDVVEGDTITASIAGASGTVTVKADCEAPPVEEPTECYCGDGTCDEEEDSYNCPQDCGSPPEEEEEEEGYCGDGICQETEDCDSCEADCGSGEEPEQPEQPEEPAECVAPDVVLTQTGSRTIWLSTYYVGGEDCIIVESDSIANNGWGSTTQICDTDDDGYIAFTPPSGYVGTSRFTFRSLQHEQNNSYADYGVYEQRDRLLCNSSESLEFVGCPWYVSSTGANNGSASACDLFATWTSNGVEGAGNMGNYHELNP